MDTLNNDELLRVNDGEYQEPTIIKAIGVGGAGGNAVNYMYTRNVKNISYLLCNTDRQHLAKCVVPDQIVIGKGVTAGLGAGDDENKARQAAEESREEIEAALDDGTRMVFITAGMGGGTGHGAAPIIARIAKDKGILTVGIITIPFKFEGPEKIIKAIKGVEEMQKNVDALIVLQNELLYDVYPDLQISDTMAKSNEVLTNSARSIAELITLPSVINVDFADVRTTLLDGGVSIITRGFAKKEEGIKAAIDRALNSPLINTTNFDHATRILMLITYKAGSEPKAEVLRDLARETGRIKNKFKFIWGYSQREDEYMEDEIGITILASGFGQEDLHLDLLTKEEEQRLIEKYYPRSSSDVPNLANYDSVIFSPGELDDDAFISFVADTPTLTRNNDELRRLRSGSRSETTPAADARPASAATPRETPKPGDAPAEDPRPRKTEIEIDDDVIIRFGSEEQ